MNQGRVLVGVFALGAACFAGCHAPAEPTEAQLDQGLVWIFPGVEGTPWTMAEACRGLRQAGVEAGIRVYDWNRPLGVLKNLMDYAGNRADAARVARKVADYRATHADQSIDFVGYSGGGGLALMVAEALPRDVRVRHILLCHPAISPDYDLTAALTHVDGKLVNFHSPLDVVLLGAGTAVFGTMDRVHGPSAGMVGLANPPNVANPLLAAKVEQQSWEPRMIGAGHPGEHFGMLTAWWNERYVAPYLCAPQDSKVAGHAPVDRSPDD